MVRVCFPHQLPMKCRHCMHLRVAAPQMSGKRAYTCLKSPKVSEMFSNGYSCKDENKA